MMTYLWCIYGSISSLYWYGVDKHSQHIIRASDYWVMKYGFKIDEAVHYIKMIRTCLWNLKSNKKNSKKINKFVNFLAENEKRIKNQIIDWNFITNSSFFIYLNFKLYRLN